MSLLRCFSPALAILLIATQFSSAIVIHDGASDAAYQALAGQYESVGWIRGTDPDGSTVLGCGVLIDEHWVLTAGHIIQESKDVEPGFDFCFGLGNNSFDGYDAGEYWQPDEVFIHPECDGYAFSPDIALLYFEEPILDVEPAVRFDGTDTIGSLITTVGYGRPGTPSSGWLDADGTKRACQNLLTELGYASYNVPEYQATARFTRASFSGGNPFGGVVAPGDSGGGWFVDVDGEMELMGITGFYTNESNYGSDSGAIRISLYNDWIDETMASVPEPTTIIMLLGMGLFFLSRAGRSSR